MGDLPNESFLKKYADEGAYTDCFYANVPGTVSQTEFVETFYTAWLFRLERYILCVTVLAYSSDRQARKLARSEISRFSAWTVEKQDSSQLLLYDRSRRTRSWLMSKTLTINGQAYTRLYFGSAIIPVINKKNGKPTLGPFFNALLGFHLMYSRALLRTCIAKIPSRQ